MQPRRYPGRQTERSGPSDWQDRGERGSRRADERDFRGGESARHDADYESAYRRFAREDVGPEDWGSEWSERSARPLAEQRGGGWRDAPGGARDPSRFGSAAERDAMRHRQGPKGYTRSDERIREDVCERLAHALDIDVSDVSVQVRDGRVELDGTVPARWMKHDIEDIADGCMCVRDVENRVRVRREGEHDTGMVLHPSQRTVTPTQPAARDPEPGSGTTPGIPTGRDREPRH
ncbi:MAG TPA: BON domain-containing protein [Burkholderia sp.]|nr:BON domain-containing protein [Burkholderia sp.]